MCEYDLRVHQPRDADDPMAPVPSIPNGKLFGYARVSTKGQLLDRRIHALNAAGCHRIYL